MNIYTEHFETVFGTRRNIQSLRNKVLELAIQGKLANQDPSDEPASELLKRIRLGEESLSKENEIKQGKPALSEKNDEVPFVIPSSWEWCKMGEIVTIGSAKRVRKADWKQEGIPFYRTREIVKLSNNGFVNNELFISEEHYSELRSSVGLPQENDLMVTGVGTIGTTYVVKESDKFYFKDASVLWFKNFSNLNAKYINWFMKSNEAKTLINKDAMGTTVSTLTIARANDIPFPLPPINEQKRIVARIESLMSEVDQLEKYLERKERLEEALPKAVVAAISSCQNEEELKAQMVLVIDSFKEVFQTPSSLQDLRNMILQLGIQGKLTPQESNDEPASKLMERIKTEKEQMIKEKQIKKENPLDKIDDDEVPFEIPNSWEWARLGEITNIRRGASPRPIKDYVTESNDGVNWIKIGDSTKGRKYIDSTNQKITKEGAEKSVLVGPGDLIMSNSMSFGHAYIMNINGCIHDGWLAFQYSQENIDSEWLLYALNASYNAFEKLAVGTGVRNLNIDRVKSVPIAIPCLNEQKRIVIKIESLLSIIDKMEVFMNKKNTLIEKMATV